MTKIFVFVSKTMEINTKILLFSVFLIILAFVILVFVLIKIREDNAPKSAGNMQQPVNFSEFLSSLENNNRHVKAEGVIHNPNGNKPSRNVLEILATDLHSFLNNTITVIFDNVYRRLFNTNLQGFIQYADGTLRFSRDSNSHSKGMLNSAGQIKVGRNLDVCLERKMIDSSGASDIIVSTITPVTQSKRWRLKSGAILDPTGNFCLGVLNDKIKLFSTMFVAEKDLKDQIDKWALIK